MGRKLLNLLSDLMKNGEAAIDRWIEEKLSEGMYFDCKLKEKSETSSLDPNDLKNLGKAISAFANSEGGLLL